MKIAVSNSSCVNEGMVQGIELAPSFNSSNDVPHKTDTQYEEYQDWAYIDKLNEEHANKVIGEFYQCFYLTLHLNICLCPIVYENYRLEAPSGKSFLFLIWNFHQNRNKQGLKHMFPLSS